MPSLRAEGSVAVAIGIAVALIVGVGFFYLLSYWTLVAIVIVALLAGGIPLLSSKNSLLYCISAGANVGFLLSILLWLFLLSFP